MAFLTPDKVRTVEYKGGTLTINEKIIPDTLIASKTICDWVKKGWKMKPCAKFSYGVKGITVHNTPAIKAASGTNAAEQYCRSTYNENMRGVVVTFYVVDTHIWQLLSEDERGWHATDGSTRRENHDKSGMIGGNLDTISIECIGDNEESIKTTAKLCAYLCDKYGLDPNKDIYTHNYFLHHVDTIVPNAWKNCPIYILPIWVDFLSQVSSYTKKKASNSKPNSETPEKVPSESHDSGVASSPTIIYRVQCGAFIKSSNALALKQQLADKGFKESILVKVEDLYKVQLGAFKVKSNATNLVNHLKSAGFDCFITQGVFEDIKTTANNSISDPKNVLKVGSKVRVVEGAKTSIGTKLASFVYSTDYVITSIRGNTACISPNGKDITARINLSDLKLIK